ncbi:MAG: HPF/RaiA family ribosome-associated protein [Burkholderiaceae bacterium]
MNVNIQAASFPLTGALLEHTQNRLRHAFSQRSDQIMRVMVRLGDNNGPRGGVDKFCHLQVQLKDARTVTINGVGEDLYKVITRVATRAGLNVARQIDRAKSRVRRRRSGSLPVQMTDHDDG